MKCALIADIVLFFNTPMIFHPNLLLGTSFLKLELSTGARHVEIMSGSFGYWYVDAWTMDNVQWIGNNVLHYRCTHHNLEGEIDNLSLVSCQCWMNNEYVYTSLQFDTFYGPLRHLPTEPNLAWGLCSKHRNGVFCSLICKGEG